MKKITKLLSVFVIAGALTASAGALAGCGHKHTFGDSWEKDATQHWHAATCEHSDEKGDLANHVDEDGDGACDVCEYAPMPLTIPSGANTIMVEGVTENYDLSATVTSATVSLANVKVYFATGNTKGEEVPKANWKVTLYKGATKLESMSGLKDDGKYTLSFELVGATGNVDNFVKDVYFNVNNPVVSIARKTGTATQVMGLTQTMTADWTFEATLANGDKKALAAADVEIGDINTLSVGEKTVTVTLKGTDVKASVPYSITENATMKVQSFVVNPSAMDDMEVKVDTPLDTNNGVTAVATSDKAFKVNGNSKTCGNKTFTKRIQLSGDANAIKIENLNTAVAGATAETKVETKVTIYAISGNSTNKRFISFTKDAETAPNVKQAVLLDGASVTKCEFVLTEEGTYYFKTFKADMFEDHPDFTKAGSNGGINLYYIQVDKIITNAPAGTQNIALPAGTDEIKKISVSTATEGFEQKFTVGDTFTVDPEYTVKGTKVNSVTCDIASDAVLTEGITYFMGETQLIPGTTVITEDMLGLSKEITVKVGEATDTYNVVVESAVAGVSGVTAKLASTVNKEVATAADKLTLNKTDIEVAIVGDNTTATIEWTAKEGATEVAFPVQLAVGNHTLTITAVVTEGTKHATFEVELAVNVTAKPAEGEVVPAAINFDGINTGSSDLEVTENKTITVNSTFITSVQTMSNTSKSSKFKIKNNTSIKDASGAEIATVNSCFGTNGGIKTNQCSIAVTLKAGKYNITLYTKQTAADRVCQIIAKDGSTKLDASTINGSATGTLATDAMNISVFNNVEGDGTIYIGGNNNIDIYYIVITPVEEATSTASVDAILPGKKEEV